MKNCHQRPEMSRALMVGCLAEGLGLHICTRVCVRAHTCELGFICRYPQETCWVLCWV